MAKGNGFGVIFESEEDLGLQQINVGLPPEDLWCKSAALAILGAKSP